MFAGWIVFDAFIHQITSRLFRITMIGVWISLIDIYAKNA